MNPVPFILIAVCAGFGWLAGGTTGAVWGASIGGSMIIVSTILDDAGVI